MVLFFPVTPAPPVAKSILMMVIITMIIAFNRFQHFAESIQHCSATWHCWCRVVNYTCTPGLTEPFFNEAVDCNDFMTDQPFCDHGTLVMSCDNATTQCTPDVSSIAGPYGTAYSTSDWSEDTVSHKFIVTSWTLQELMSPPL